MARLRAMIRLGELPPLPEMKRILAITDFSAAVAGVDRRNYATAVHHRIAS